MAKQSILRIRYKKTKKKPKTPPCEQYDPPKHTKYVRCNKEFCKISKYKNKKDETESAIKKLGIILKNHCNEIKLLNEKIKILEKNCCSKITIKNIKKKY